MPRTDRKLTEEQQMRQALLAELRRRGLQQRLVEVELSASEQHWAREREACAADVVYFVNTYCKVTSDRGEGVIPFQLWDYQKDLLRAYQQHREVIVLKGRQLGITEITAAYTIWFVTHKPAVTAIILSKGESEANEVLNKAWLMYRHLPEELRPALRDTTRTSTIELANGSRILPMPTTRGAGRSYNAQLLIFDEWAFQMFQEEIFGAAAPTARSAGNQIIGISTANGLGNFYSEQWHQAVDGRGMHPIFLPWHLRPGRDDAWYADATRGMPEWQKAQEYPSSADEAFIMTGRPRFEIAAIDDLLERTVKDPVLEELGGDLRVWEQPAPGKRYVCGADPSEGLLKGDYSAAVVLDCETGLEVAELHGHWAPDTFALHLATLCRAFNGALCAVELNNHGHAVVLALTSLYGYQNLYYHHEYDGQQTNRPGWLTTTKSKPIAVEGLSRAISERRSWRNARFLAEAKHYVIGDKGDTGASGNLHDDRVMAYAIAEQVRLYTPPTRELLHAPEDVLFMPPSVIDGRYGAPWTAMPGGQTMMGAAMHYGVVDPRYATGQEELDAWLMGGPPPGVIDNRYLYQQPVYNWLEAGLFLGLR